MTTWTEQRRLRRRRRRRMEEIVGWIVVPPMLVGLWWGGTYVYDTFKEPAMAVITAAKAIQAKGLSNREP